MGIESSIANNLTSFFIGLGLAFLLTLWISLVIWVYRDIRRRTDDPLVRIVAVTVSVVLFLPGVLIYIVLRPTSTIDEKYQSALEEEALLATLEESELCPGCERKTHNDWLACPSCHTLLKKKCPDCGKLIELTWDLCPFCGLELTPHKPEKAQRE